MRLAFRLLASITTGLAFALLTQVLMGDHSYRPAPGIGFVYLGELLVILLLPGIFASVMVSGNVHLFSAWIAALGNFVFYFSVVYVTLTRRKRGAT